MCVCCVYGSLSIDCLQSKTLTDQAFSTPHAQQPLMVKMKAAMIRYIPIIHLNLAIVLYFHFLMTSVAANI